MRPDPIIEDLNAKLSALVRQLDATTASFASAFAAFLKEWYPRAAERAVRLAPDRAIAAAQRGRLSALKHDVRALVEEAPAIARRTVGDSALWWHANPEAPSAGVHEAVRRALGLLDERLYRAGLIGEVQRDDRGRTTWADDTVPWSDEMIARWEEYLELLRRTGECLDAIEAHGRKQMEAEALGLWTAS